MGEVRGEWGDRKKIRRSWGGGGERKRKEGGRERVQRQQAWELKSRGVQGHATVSTI